MLVVIDTLRTATKGVESALEELKFSGRIETIQTTALLRSVKILRRAQETTGDFADTQTPVRAPSNADVNKLII